MPSRVTRSWSTSARTSSAALRADWTAHQVSWWAVQSALSAALLVLADVDQLRVTRLGIDEHRYRSVRYWRDEGGTWHRFEPWMSTIVDVDTGQVLGVVDGRDSVGVGAWLTARSQAWRDRVEGVAIDPSGGAHAYRHTRLADVQARDPVEHHIHLDHPLRSPPIGVARRDLCVGDRPACSQQQSDTPQAPAPNSSTGSQRQSPELLT